MRLRAPGSATPGCASASISTGGPALTPAEFMRRRQTTTLGASLTVMDGYAGVWLFTDNEEFFGGARREQDPIGALQLHASYTFRPRLWLAVDSTWYAGGQSTVDGVHNDDRQSNTRVGLTVSLPLGDRQSLKLSWSDGATTRIGGDFNTIGVAWQHTWLPRSR